LSEPEGGRRQPCATRDWVAPAAVAPMSLDVEALDEEDVEAMARSGTSQHSP
jgi:hypothetical protein